MDGAAGDGAEELIFLDYNRNAYAKQCRKIEEEEKGRAEFYERESLKSDWLLTQEFELNESEE